MPQKSKNDILDEVFSSGPSEPFYRRLRSRMPMPKRDPRKKESEILTAPKDSPDRQKWIDRLPSAPPGYDTGESRVVPPGLMLHNYGISPSRKHGDAIDYHTNPRFWPVAPERIKTGGKIRGYATDGFVEPEEAPQSEPSPWDMLPKSPEGRPQITVTKPTLPPQQVVSPETAVTSYYDRIKDRMLAPPPIKPNIQPNRGLEVDQSQAIGEGIRGAASEYVQGLKDLSDPFYKGEEGKYTADQNLPEDAYKGKVLPAQKDPINIGAPVAAEVAGTFAGQPGTGLLWGPISKAAALFGAKVAAKQFIAPATHGLTAEISKLPGFLDTSSFKNVHGQLGFMPGGVFESPNGKRYYVKVGPDVEQIKNEQLGSKLYALAGTPVANVHLTHTQGHPGIASEFLPDSVQLSEVVGKTPLKDIQGLHDNFVVDAWLANHDAVGTGGENPLGNIMIQNGKAVRIDTGGSLRYKGSGEIKKHFHDNADEIFSMRDPSFSKRSAEIFSDISDEALRMGAQKVANVNELALAKLIAEYGPKDIFEQQKLYDKLLKRRQFIMDHFGVKPGGSVEAPAISAGAAKKEASVFDDPAMTQREASVGKPLSAEEWEKLDKEMEGYKIHASPHEYGFESANDEFMAPQAYGKFSDNLPSYELEHIYGGEKLPKAHLNTIGKLLQKGEDTPAWNAAAALWDMAERVNPQTAEAIFRALGPKIQIEAGQRIAALKEQLGYSPFNAVAKGSGKSGHFTDFDFFTTHTTFFKPSATILNGPKFQESLNKYASHFEGQKLTESELKAKEPKASLAPEKKNIEKAVNESVESAPETKVLWKQDLGWASPGVNKWNDFPKILEAYTANGVIDIPGIGWELAQIGKQYPGYADALVSVVPQPLKGDIKAALIKAQSHLQKSEEAKNIKIAKLGSFSKEEGYNKFTSSKNPIGTAYADKFLKPIKSWRDWKPPTGAELPDLGSMGSTAYKQGYNPNFTLFKGWTSGIKGPDPENPSVPKEILPIRQEKQEPGLFLSDQERIADKYHSGSSPPSSFVSRAERAFEVDWKSAAKASAWDPAAMANIIEAAKQRKADIIAIHGMSDVGGYNQTQYVVLNPSILRSPKAKFDVSNLHKSWPMAGIVGGALFTLGSSKDEMNRGGTPFARGGPGSAPWNVRRASHPRHPPGMIKSSIPGRTDKIPMSVPSGSYIIPADVPSALGQGNTMAGNEILGKMLKTGPYGSGATGKIPKVPQSGGFKWMKAPRPMSRMKAAMGGEQTGNSDIPIIAAGGEYVVHPEQVAEVGNGDVDAGHRVLDKFVLGVRKKNIKTLQKLKPPKK